MVNVRAYARLMRLDRPIGTFLLLWPTLWAVWLASDGQPELSILVIFITGTFVMRAAGCIINDYADRHVDGYVKRTCNRPLVTGEITSKQALRLFALLCVVALVLVLQTNGFTLVIACIGAAMAVLYPFTKRFVSVPQLFLGLTWGLGILMSFATIRGQLPALAWFLYAAHIVTTVAYDTAYAMVDRDDDLKVGIRSTAVLLGFYAPWVIGVLQGFFLLIMCHVGQLAGLGLGYNVALCVAAGLLVYQQRLIFQGSREACFKAFLNNHWVGMVIFLGIVMDGFLR